jgi:hypothetical protein
MTKLPKNHATKSTIQAMMNFLFMITPFNCMTPRNGWTVFILAELNSTASRERRPQGLSAYPEGSLQRRFASTAGITVVSLSVHISAKSV